jgi:hypothetical protein
VLLRLLWWLLSIAGSAVQIGASKVYIEDLRRDFLDNYITPSIQANGTCVAQFARRCNPAKFGRSLSCDSACATCPTPSVAARLANAGGMAAHGCFFVNRWSVRHLAIMVLPAPGIDATAHSPRCLFSAHSSVCPAGIYENLYLMGTSLGAWLREHTS